jgi:flagellar FliL protein
MTNDKQHLWSLDCICICTVLGFALDAKNVGKLCRKFNLSKPGKRVDASFGFYLLHKACHEQGGLLPKRLTKLLNERYERIIQIVRATEEGSEDRILAQLEEWIKQTPAGIMWALLTDPRESFQCLGVYLVHQIAYSAFRDSRERSWELRQEEEQAKKQGSIPPMIMTAAVIVVALLAAYFVAGTVVKPILSGGGGKTEAAKKSESHDSKHDGHGGHGGGHGEEGAEASKIFNIEGIVVNPASTGGSRFLTTTIGFELDSPDSYDAFKEKQVKIRDALISILSSKTVTELADIDTREKIRSQILKLVNHICKPAKAEAIYFVDFVLQ